MKAMGLGAAKYKGTLMREKKLTEMIERKVTEAKGDERMQGKVIVQAIKQICIIINQQLFCFELLMQVYGIKLK